jgi:hypothetical protein
MDSRTQTQGFERAMGEAKKQASNVAQPTLPLAKRPVHSKRQPATS